MNQELNQSHPETVIATLRTMGNAFEKSANTVAASSKLKESALNWENLLLTTKNISTNEEIKEIIKTDAKNETSKLFQINNTVNSSYWAEKICVLFADAFKTDVYGKKEIIQLAQEKGRIGNFFTLTPKNQPDNILGAIHISGAHPLIL